MRSDVFDAEDVVDEDAGLLSEAKQIHVRTTRFGGDHLGKLHDLIQTEWRYNMIII